MLLSIAHQPESSPHLKGKHLFCHRIPFAVSPAIHLAVEEEREDVKYYIRAADQYENKIPSFIYSPLAGSKGMRGKVTQTERLLQKSINGSCKLTGGTSLTASFVL